MGHKAVKLRQSVQNAYRDKHKKSEEFFIWGQKLFPGGMPRNLQYHHPFPIVIDRGEGSKLYDLDGNEYVDFCNNFASLVLGHAHPDIRAAVTKAIAKGSVHSNPTPIQYELAETLSARIPCIDTLRFTNSGTEAAIWAIRVARAYSGKDKILKVEGGYHGLSDCVDISIHPATGRSGSPSNPLSVPDDQGIPESVVQDTLVAPFNNQAATQAIIEKNANELAAVIVEPMLGAAGMIPPEDGYLHLLRDLTALHNILLIFDEVITLRLAYGGGQERFYVKPDLCMLGKVMGGGFPVGAFGGRKNIMALVSPVNNVVSHSGTFTGNNATMAAGLTTLKALTHAALDELERKGNTLREKTNQIFKEVGIKGQATGLGSCFAIHFMDGPIRNYRDLTQAKDDQYIPDLLNLHLLNRGFYLSRRSSGFISLVNSDEEIEAFLEALQESLSEMKPVVVEETPELIIS